MVWDKWKEKAMHGKFPNYLDKSHVYVELSFEWMKHTVLKGEAEGLITAVQDQAHNTRYYSKQIIKQGTTDQCSMYHTQPETVEHIISTCQTLAADQYLSRHNQVASQLHLEICKHYGIKMEAKLWYQHKPERITENNKPTILCHSQIITDRHVPCNKPDIVIQEKQTDRCMMIDVAILIDYYIQKKATEKADDDRIYLPCHEGGRGLMNLEKEYKATMVGLYQYLTNKEDAQISALLRHHTGTALYSVSKETIKYLAEAGTSEDTEDTQPLNATKKAKKPKYKYNRDYKKMMKDRWYEKPMHGKFPNHLGKEYIGIQQSFQWMKHSGVKGEPVGLLTPAPDQALNTRYYNKYIMKEGHTGRCRMCHSQPETVEHIISGCQDITR